MNHPSVDLDAESRRALEFDALLERIALGARTKAGALLVRAIIPRADIEAVREELAAMGEAQSCLQQEGRIIPGGLPDPSGTLELLPVEGLRLEAKALRDLATVLGAAAAVRGRLLSLPVESYPRLASTGRSMPDLQRMADEILRCIDPDGRIADDASSELRRIRRAHTRLGERLQGLLRRMMRGPDVQPVIQDEFITQRNGRYVIPIRSDAPRRLPGIVHAASSSGATRFVEPLESVELNNDLVRLSEEEREEQQRILLAWTEDLRSRKDAVATAVEALSRLDCLQARAIFGEECAGILPSISAVPVIVFDAVRHPLLDLQLRQQGERCVPLSLLLDPADRALVLSGPNTGGKTVALKTFGLAVLMAQSGIPVPAAKLRLPVYSQVRADIGDHQSIEANLSTFSGHVGAIARYLDAASPPALFLLDEIGSGTEPTEGSALAQSILEELLEPEMTVIATTHQDALKAWALTTDRAISAAMEFDDERLRPTYRILMGATGVSAGLEIAERLGLSRRVVERARERLGPEGQLGRRYADRLRELTAELEERRAALLDREQELAEDKRRLESRALDHERRRRNEVSVGLERAMKELRARLQQELSTFKNKRERQVVRRELSGIERRLEQQKSQQQAELTPELELAGPVEWTVPAKLYPGLRVFVRSLGREGELLEERGERVDVRLGSVTFAVDRSDLRVRLLNGGTVADGSAKPELRDAPRRSIVALTDAPRELKLLGLRVDEALELLDKFLDAALLAGHDEVRVIHGHGTGRLREAVRRFLESHAQVQSHRSGRRQEGGDGATVVKLN